MSVRCTYGFYVRLISTNSSVLCTFWGTESRNICSI